MSNALAIASVTAVLKDLLDNAMISKTVSENMEDMVSVRALPPDLVKSETGEKALLNLFLYHIAPNMGWSNRGLPSIDSNGERCSNPPLALDLYYLLTAYGKHDYEAEILLGYAMQVLHENPIIGRDAIRKSLNPTGPDEAPVSGIILPTAMRALSASDLADQVELIKITPYTLSSEEVSKLWTAFQTSYRPSVAYLVSVVLIESQRSTKSSLPVRQRNLYALPFHQPVIEKLMTQNSVNDPVLVDSPVLPGQLLIVSGRGLRGGETSILMDGVECHPQPEDVSDKRIRIQLPPLSAGVHGAQVLHKVMMGTPATFHRGVESNVAAFVMHPVIESQSVSSGVVSIKLLPGVGKKQRIMLLLNERNPSPNQQAKAYSFPAPARENDDEPDHFSSIDIPISDVKSGDYLIRVQVDGAESQLNFHTASGLYNSPVVNVP
jgi:hypothetical protein